MVVVETVGPGAIHNPGAGGLSLLRRPWIERHYKLVENTPTRIRYIFKPQYFLIRIYSIDR